MVDITDESTMMPTISGFSQTNEIQRFEFELIVSDGALDSRSDAVQVVAVVKETPWSLLVSAPSPVCDNDAKIGA